MPTWMLSWKSKCDLVPWGYPCKRTEGGLRTGKGVPEDSCQVGVPSGVNIVARRFLVDETIGAVVAFCTFGVGGLPDTHLFRVEHGQAALRAHADARAAGVQASARPAPARFGKSSAGQRKIGGTRSA